jgi:alpha-beta hydrolase superfamily lysophospholipase
MSVAVCAMAVAASRASAAPTEAFDLRGVGQTLHLYGPPGGRAAIVASGDGGWIHLAPQIAEVLALEGYRVIGLDSKAYLSSFTSRTGPLRVDEVPRDFEALVARASREGHGRPLLFGISEGAGLSVLAATDPRVRDRIAGVVALGLPDLNELGWRWRDSIIYVTKKTPDEPTFSVLEVVDRIAPLPLAAIHSLRDEFVAVDEIQGIVARAREPKRLWLVDAADHRFSGAPEDLRRSLLEAVAWAEAHAPAAH